MKTRVALLFALLAICLFSEGTAAFGQTLYPVQGPLTAQSPPPIFTARFTGGNSGKLSMVRANGELLTGKWSRVTAAFVNNKTPGTADSYPPQPNLAFAWDAIYGQGYFLANVLGVEIGAATGTGNQGTVLQAEFFPGRFGVAIDNKGNIYKMVW
ncbi:MAG: hypothetical protein ABSF16_04470 [Terracidiphilus sp.]|jgi:hypothetical protein